MPAAHYEVQSFDCQVLNPSYPTTTGTNPAPPQGPSTKSGGAQQTVAAKNMSILVLLSGYVRFGETRDLPPRGFSETVVLVPNQTVDQGARKVGKGRKDWLIQSQNFRLVV